MIYPQVTIDSHSYDTYRRDVGVQTQLGVC
jgi:hypothetical protein